MNILFESAETVAFRKETQFAVLSDNISTSARFREVLAGLNKFCWNPPKSVRASEVKKNGISLFSLVEKGGSGKQKTKIVKTSIPSVKITKISDLPDAPFVFLQMTAVSLCLFA